MDYHGRGSWEATVGSDEKYIDLVCAASKAKIQTTFEISKMEDSQGETCELN
jgi:hypothetical protein